MLLPNIDSQQSVHKIWSDGTYDIFDACVIDIDIER